VVWAGIPVTPPGSNASRVFRITNVRANAAGLGASQTLIPTQIVAFISVAPQGTLPIDNPQQTVAYVQTGLTFATTDCDGDSATRNFNQCQNPGGGVRDLPTGGTADGPQFGLRWTEGFQTAFKTRLAVDQVNSLPGQSFNTESGFVRATADPAGTSLGTAGVATNATRLAARFFNVPAGVRIFVGTQSSARSGDDFSTAGTSAVLVSTDPSGLSGIVTPGAVIVEPVAIAGTATLTCGSSTVSAAEIPLVNGAGTAVYEVTGESSASLDTVHVLAAILYTANLTANTPALGTANIVGQFAPFFAAGTGDVASAALPIPRFVERPRNDDNFFRINQCVTNLLFPYVTNWSNFDTGIAISNTSKDPFSSPNDRLQSGRCTLNYYGKMANGDVVTASEQTDRVIDAGDHATVLLSGGGTHGLKGQPNFQGYIIAQCGFLYGHGFAFITDGPVGQARVAEGYLALVLDGSTIVRGSSVGEQKGH
jgi:hypothetical protein